MRIGTSCYFFNAVSLVPEIKYVISKCWLRNIFSFAAAHDTGENEEEASINTLTSF